MKIRSSRVNIKEVVCDAFRKNKIKFIIILFCTLTSLFAGIIIAIKTKSLDVFTSFLGDAKKLKGTNFWLRLLSMLVIFGFVLLGSLRVWLSPFAILFISYRAFLLGGNISLLIILNGLSGFVIGLIVVLPCQILSLILFVLFYLLLCEGRGYRKSYGCDRMKNYNVILILAGVGCFILICLLESLFIWLLSPQIIFVF